MKLFFFVVSVRSGSTGIRSRGGSTDLEPERGRAYWSFEGLSHLTATLLGQQADMWAKSFAGSLVSRIWAAYFLLALVPIATHHKRITWKMHSMETASWWGTSEKDACHGTPRCATAFAVWRFFSWLKWKFGNSWKFLICALCSSMMVEVERFMFWKLIFEDQTNMRSGLCPALLRHERHEERPATDQGGRFSGWSCNG